MLLTAEGRRRDNPPAESGNCIMRSDIISISVAGMIECGGDEIGGLGGSKHLEGKTLEMSELAHDVAASV